ncbi:MAG: DUF2089 family protein [Candidatus Delongbacteria bacterium]|jgi:hypothetical protein|nr:DUF2089 family protein [Candidatus Delongbacteria bacterium]
MKKLLTKCPVCEGELKVVKYQCKKCNTKISGEFEKDEMCHGLSDEIFDFIKVFIAAEGSIKQAEKILNCSYPKIKNLLKKTKAALELEKEEDVDTGDIIDMISKGEFSVEEALKKLKK